MAQFVELENGDILNRSCINLLYPHVGIKNDSEKIEVRAAIRIECNDGRMELIAETSTAHFPDQVPDKEMEIYELFWTERENLEKAIRDLFPHIVHGLFLDLNIYYPSLAIREQLQRSVKEATDRIAEAAKKMEAEDE